MKRRVVFLICILLMSLYPALPVLADAIVPDPDPDPVRSLDFLPAILVIALILIAAGVLIYYIRRRRRK